MYLNIFCPSVTGSNSRDFIPISPKLKVFLFDEPQCLQPGVSQLIPTGIALYIQDHTYAAKILPRSGLGHKQGIVLGNGTGLIDADYQGPLFVSCLNRGSDVFTVNPGDRIAQIIFIPIARPELVVVDNFEQTHRGEGGFGSTGV